MQEIASQIYIETAYPGVTLGAINWPHGLILIDSPIRLEDSRAWRSVLLNLSGGVDRLLINLDAHYDRTVGSRNMDCTIVGHEKMVQIFRNRPLTFKAQGAETGAEWEMLTNLGSIRWAPPEITFTDKLNIYWDSSPMVLEYRPGASASAIWVNLPEEKVLFVGDTVVPGQPPYLANAELPVWIEQLKTLLGKEYQHYLLVSGRGGLVAVDEVRKQLRFLEKVQSQLENMGSRNATPEDTHTLVGPLLSSFNPPPELKDAYRQRLRFGLKQYYLRHFNPGADGLMEE